MENPNQTKLDAPSKGALAKATGIALVVALILLFTAVLPAEYGFDPLRTGAALRLMGISQASTEKETAATPAPVQTGVITPETKLYKVYSEEFELRPDDGMEMKFHMQKGASMVYGWKADGNLTFEFHGEPDQKPNKDYYESYELNDKTGKDSYYGSFIAPSTGVHGWFFENKTKKDVKFHLYTAGFFDIAKMYAGGPPDDIPVEDPK